MRWTKRRWTSEHQYRKKHLKKKTIFYTWGEWKDSVMVGCGGGDFFGENTWTSKRHLRHHHANTKLKHVIGRQNKCVFVDAKQKHHHVSMCSFSSKWQIRLKPIFSRPVEATGSVPGHTNPRASTPTAASADSAKADQPGMKTTLVGQRLSQTLGLEN